ncbi:MAG: response regulator, partial [Phaeodactylibacter sp.]|nr:response regulator [Phaeodactylibacter sp.]
VGTDDGLSRASRAADGQLRFTHFLKDVKVYATLFYDQKLWVGTFGEGLFALDPDNGQTQHYTTADGLPGNTVLGILPDERGQLWLSTNNGLSRFDPITEGCTNYSHSNGLEDLEFNYNAFCRTRSGEFLFGGTHGLTRFHPDDLRPSTTTPSIVFTGLTAFNRQIEVGEEDGLLQRPLNETEVLTFNYGDANFTLHFAALDYTNPRGNRYAYRMLGLNEEWTTVTGRPEATYTLQQEGEYVFQLKAANKDGLWNPAMRELRVRVLPPPTRTWWAYLIYSLLIVMAVAALVRITRLRQSYRLERLEKKQQAAIHQMKMRFFTNVAHEFRTPLTLIIGPLEELLQRGFADKDGSIRGRLGTIYSNAQRMLNLVNQLLTFRKMEEGYEPMEVLQTDLSVYLRTIFDSFVDHARMRSIQYTFKGADQAIELWLDREKITKVLFNLLSNAFKFTPDGGKISLELSQEQKEVILAVADNGPGIDPALHEQIFQRFYEKTPGQTPNQIKGTGIGLALSRQLVELHSGRLELSSTVGQGSVFRVILPTGKEHFRPEDLQQEEQLPNPLPAFTGLPVHSPATVADESVAASVEDSQQPILLIVEDNPEVQGFIRSIFAGDFQILVADDGKTGLQIAEKEQPDIILSDVMMPNMDGFEMCRQLKTNLATSHIPVLLLTARTTLNDRLEGLETGADDYISKPFHPNEIRLKVHNRVAQRRRMRAHFGESRDFAPKEITVTSADEAFLHQLIALVEANIDNPEFKIEQFAQELAVSRALLFTKIKALTNFTPKNFLKSFRLKRAAQLLKSGKLNISDVAYQVGFKEPKYFSRVFQKEYGCNPSAYMDMHPNILGKDER